MHFVPIIYSTCILDKVIDVLHKDIDVLHKDIDFLHKDIDVLHKDNDVLQTQRCSKQRYWFTASFKPHH